MKFKAIFAAILLTGCVMTTPDHVAGKYCAISTDSSKAGQMKTVLKKDLRQLWDAAEKYNQDWADQHPGEKPPFGDGIPTQAYPDYASICRVESIMGEGDQREADILHGFPNSPESGWTDRLILVPEGGTWVISDILFAPDFKTGLRQVLQDALKAE